MKKTKFNTDLCNEQMTFNECELAILRHAVDETENNKKEKLAKSEEVAKMTKILETFLIKKKRICYGGTAINNILPQHAQFYNKDVEIPDYDFYSPQALEDAKELANVFHLEGYKEVEAKSGVHHGTFKVFVNFIPMADITYLHPLLYKSIQKEQITIFGIKYAPVNFLRMNMFLELSRPMGDVSRWEKVLKRLNLLNTYFPFTSHINCKNTHFQRNLENAKQLLNTKKNNDHNPPEKNVEKQIYDTVRDTFLSLGVVFFGGYGCSLYSMYLPKSQQNIIKKIPDFDVLSEDPDKTGMIVKENLDKLDNMKKITIVHHEQIGEIIPYCVEIKIMNETIAFIYQPIACHNYNTIKINKQNVNVATIDTILSFYLAFYYTNKPYYSYFKERFLCMAQFMFDVEQKNRLQQKGLLKRFSISCYGKQMSLEDIRAEKTRMFEKLGRKKNTIEYEMWFLKYNPAEQKHFKKIKHNHTHHNHTTLKKKHHHKYYKKYTEKRRPTHDFLW